MKTVSEIYKKHPILSITCVVLFLFCIIPLSPLGYESIIGFKKDPVNWNNYISNLYGLAITTTVALIVYLLVDKKTSDKIDEIKHIEENIKEKAENISAITKNVKDNIDKMENNIQKISEIQKLQEKVVFETEKNRLINFAQHSSLSEQDKKFFKSNIMSIFHEPKYSFSQMDQDNKMSNSFEVIFIKNSNSRLPKMFYPFGRGRDFPYFCVRVIEKYPPVKKNESNEVQIDSHYYLSYDFSDKNWRLSEGYPIEGSVIRKSFKVIFSGTNFVGNPGPPAEEFCKNC